MRTIRASEIGSYLYCQRAWWYQKTGAVPENQNELLRGTRIHAEHGRRVLAAGCMQTLAYILLLSALALAAAYAATQLF